nr:hypothetical protein [uncultured Methanoregula sp.]
MRQPDRLGSVECFLLEGKIDGNMEDSRENATENCQTDHKQNNFPDTFVHSI